MGEFFPVIIVAKDFARDMIGVFAGKKSSKFELFFEGYSASDPHLASVFDFLPAGAFFAGGENLVGHIRVCTAGGEAVGLNVVFGVFGGDGFDETDDGGLGGGVSGEVGPGREGAAAADDDDFAGAALDHFRKYGAAGVHNAKDVGLEGFAPFAGISIMHQANRPLDAGSGDKDVGAAKAGAHAFDRYDHPVKFADIAGETEGDSAGVLNFEVGEIDFGFGASDEADRSAFGGETDGKAFSNAATGSGDENSFSLQVELIRRVS